VQPHYRIEKIDIDHLEEALSLVWNVFQIYEAPDYSEQGVLEFKSFIEIDSIKQKLLQQELRMWVYRIGARIVGVLAVRSPCHISLLFVDEEYHRKGIARSLIDVMTGYYRSLSVNREITVNSSPYAQEAYHRLGFTDTDHEQVINGIHFIPMRRPL